MVWQGVTNRVLWQVAARPTRVIRSCLLVQPPPIRKAADKCEVWFFAFRPLYTPRALAAFGLSASGAIRHSDFAVYSLREHREHFATVLFSPRSQVRRSVLPHLANACLEHLAGVAAAHW